MIIVSQDKDNIINFDNTTSVWIDDNVLNKTNASFEIYADDEIVGEYKTEERAKEVLEEIILKYAEYAEIRNNSRNIQSVASLPKIFYMPKE